MIINLLLIAVIVVFVVDESGFTWTLKTWLSKLLNKMQGKNIYTKDNIDIRPFECSLCMTFWCGTLYLIVSGSLTLMAFACVCIMAYLSRTFKDVFDLLQFAADALLNKIYKLLK